MLITRITELGVSKASLLNPALVSNYVSINPAMFLSKDVCPGSRKGPAQGKSGGTSDKIVLKRALKPGQCRMGMIPEEWFLFFHSKTGVTGPYLLGILGANYLISKEIYIMEHEYYSGLSIALILYFIVTKFGPAIGASLDRNVEEIANEFEKSRKDEIAFYDDKIKESKDLQWRAEGQKDLMSAKKENIAMQLEAEYRERTMRVYRTVRGRMDYHVKRYRAESRIQQKWMIGWILENVNKGITPEFQQQALTSAISDLGAAADRSK